MKRRSFLKKSALATSLPIMLGGIPINAISKSASLKALTGMATELDRVLVLIQLNGGNDGLNTVIPIDQYANLSAVRNNIVIPETSILPLTTETGLHPAMTGMQSLYTENKLAVVQSVGYPDPNFSHFRSTDIWTSASPSNEVYETGWMGRYLDSEYPGYPDGYPNPDNPDPLAITVGALVSPTCQGMTANLGIAIQDPDAFNQLLTGGVDTAPNTPYGHELTFLRQTILQTNLYIETIKDASAAGMNQSSLYPMERENPLADQLKIVARLIHGGLQTRLYIVTLGGFDTHANQVEMGDPLTGQHNRLLTYLSQAVTAFQDDLELMSIDERVMGMTFSEFGRRIGSNGSFGTDHGAAAPLMLFGTKVNGQLYGSNPIIPAVVNPEDSLPMQYDFRSIYGSVLMDWFCVEEDTVKNFLYDDFQHIPVVENACTTSTSINDLQEVSHLLGQNYPNPFSGTTRIPFKSEGGRVQIQVFDSTGRSIKTVTDQNFAPGEYEVTFDGHDLPGGIYYYRMQHQDRQTMKLMTLAK